MLVTKVTILSYCIFWLLTYTKESAVPYKKTPRHKLKLFVFDLDCTLWPFWVDTHVDPPFRKLPNGKIIDRMGRSIKYYPEVPQIFKYLRSHGYSIAVASRTTEIKGARQLIKLFGWEKYIQYQQIFPSRKMAHFYNLRRVSHVNFDEMIFFDDEERNIKDIKRLGIVSIFVKNGMTKDIIKYGISKYLSTYH